MSEQNPAPGQDPTANSPEDTGAGTQEINWQERAEAAEKRFADTQAWGTQQSQEAARLRQEAQQYEQILQAAATGDQEALRWVSEITGRQFVQDEPTDPTVNTELERRLAQIEQQQGHYDQYVQQQEEQAAYDRYQRTAASELGQMGVPSEFHQLVADTALSNAQQSGREPDLAEAFEQVKAMAPMWAQLDVVQNEVKRGWETTKPSRAVTTPGGLQATHVPELKTRADRAAFIGQQLAELDTEV